MQTIRILALLLALAGFARAASPTIDTQPANATNCPGTTASFAVTASGTDPLAYQWYFNETNSIPDATNATLYVSNVAPANAGGYSVIVTNSEGSATSIVALLVVNDLTTATGPANTSVCPGGTATLTTVASGTGPFSYVWRKDGGAPLSSTSNSLEIAGATAGDAGVYSVEVTGACNSVTNSATLTLNTVTAATGPDNTNACSGTSVTLTTVPSGTGPFTYVWRKDGGAPLSSDSNSFTISPVLIADAGVYSVEVSGACNSVTNSAVLTVTPSPTASVNSETICPGNSAVLTATSDAVNPTYLWSPGGQTTQSVTNSPGTTTTYTVTVTDGVTGCSVQASGTITVLTNTTVAVANQTNCPGTTATFTAVVSGTGPFTYVWRKDGGAPLGETSDTLTITSVTAADAGVYSVEVTGNCNSATNSGTLVVVGTPTITAQPQSQATPMGNGAVFSVTASTVSTTVGPLSYQWLTNGLDAGVTASSIAVSNLTLADSGRTFQVIVSNCSGSVTSLVAVLTVTPLSGISFDFDTPGQFTNAPYYLAYNNWINGANLLPPGLFEHPVGGTGPFPGSGALDLIPNNGSENTSILLPVSFDFSLPGKTLYASTMVKIKSPTSNNRNTQFGFVTATNLGVNDQTPQGFATVILQSTAQPAATYELRHQRRTSGGGLQESTLAAATGLTVSNWYKLTICLTNTRTAGNSNYSVRAWLQDMGPFGTNTGGPTNLSFFTATNNADIVNFRNVYLAIRGFENTGVENRDVTCAWTTPGAVFFVQEPQNVTATQGTRAVFRAYVDGEGPYRYQWQRDDGIGGFTNIPLAGSWNYITPATRTSDNGSQYRVVVTGPDGTIITSGPATLTVTPLTLGLVSAGSVDGTTVGLLFNQPVDPTSATNVSYYTIDGVNPKHARVHRTSLSAQGPEGIYVVLTPVSPVAGSFTVVVNSVQDLSGGSIGGANSASGSVAGLTGYDVNPFVTGPPGENYSFGPGQYIVTGGGSDIFSGLDGFRFVYRTVTGDFDQIIRIPYMDTTRFTAKAGIDARFSLDPASPGVLVAFNPGPIAEGSSTLRQYTEGTSKQTWGAGGTSWGTNRRLYHPDVWLRIRRSANTFLRYSSTNGVNWMFDGQITPASTPPATMYVGLAVSAARNLQPESAQFESYGSFAGYSGASITLVSTPGNFTVAAGSTSNATVVATGTGGGIVADGELSYVWQRSDGLGGFTNLPNAGVTNNTITLGPLYFTDSGAEFRVIVKAPGAADQISPTFTATVTDTAAPTVAGVNSPTFGTYQVSELVVNFNEFVSEASATNIANYLVTNAAGTQLTVLNAYLLNGDPRNVVLIVDGQLGYGTSAVAISGVQDLAGNTLTPVVRTFRSFKIGTGPVVVEYYQDIGNVTTIAALTGHATYTAGQPSWISYSNLFGANVGVGAGTFPGQSFSFGTVAEDNMGVKAYTYFVPPTNGQYKFWVRGDDVVQLFINTNAVNSTDPAGKQLIAELTGANGNYGLGTTLANSKTNIALTGGQAYYMEVLMKETGGNDGFSVNFTHPSTTTAPGNATFIPTANLAYPASAAPNTPVISEIYQGYTPPLTGNGNLPTLTSATNFPLGTVPFPNESQPNFKYLAGLPDHVGAQKYFAFQPQLGNTRVENYLGRLISYFVAPSNGNYKFYMRADDAAQLYMNTNAVNSTDQAGIQLLGRLDAYTSAYTLVAQNVSLVGGQRYLLEALWREGTGGDGVALAVRAQSDVSVPPIGPPTETIPASMLEYPVAYGRVGVVSFDGIATTPTIEGEAAVMIPLGVKGGMLSGAGHGVNAGPAYGLIWLRNGVRVAENSFTNVTPPLTLADDGATYTLIITNQFSRAERSVTISVTADTTAPVVQSIVGWRDGDGFSIQFNEPMDKASVENLGNYMADNGLGLLSATLDPTRRKVAVQTTRQTGGTTYTVMLLGLKDGSAAGNAVSTNVSFSTWGYGGNAILVEVFTNLNGNTIADLTGAPKFTRNLPDLVYYTNVFGYGPFAADSGRQYYGARLTGLYVPTNTGYYRFYLRSDDASQLYMNINSANSEDPAGKTMLVHVPNANVSMQDPRAISPPVFLNQGQRYFMEALLKEGTGGDYLILAHRAVDASGNSLTGVPADAATEAIGLSFFGSAPGNPDLIALGSSPPSELFVTESDLVSLGVVLSAPAYIQPYIAYTWQKFDGASYTNIPGANGATYNFFASCFDDGATYRVLVSAPGRDFSFTTLLHVATDVDPPYVVSANSLDGYTIGVAFNEPVDPGTGGDPGTYLINNDGNITILSAVVQSDPRKVLLTLLAPIPGPFTLDILGINDQACSPNFGMSATTGGFQKLSPMDIGAPPGAGSSFTSTNNEIDVVAGGADIWGTADQGHMVLGQRSGDFDVWARLDSLSRVPGDTDGITKAGIMIRETLAPDARKLHYLAEPPASIGGRDIIEAGQRPYATAATAAWAGGNGNTGVPAGVPNTWVRIKRVGHIFSALRSSNGVDWILTTTQAMSLPNTLYVGLAATAHIPAPSAGTTLAKFRNVHVPCPPTITVQPSPASQDLAIHGSVSYSVTATNPPDSGALTYQWYRDGVLLTGETAASLSIPNVGTVHDGLYTVKVGNDGGQVDSDAVNLSVSNALPVVTGESFSVTQGMSLTLSTLLTNDSDPEMDAISLFGVVGVPRVAATDFESGGIAGATNYGSAFLESGVLKLTTNGNSLSGSYVLSEVIPGKRVHGFTANFRLRIGDGTAEPADGFSFNFGNDLPDSAAAPAAAEQGATATGLSFCVDNYRFAPLGLGLAYNAPAGGVPNTSGLKINYNGIIIAGVQIPTWNSPNYVPVSITLTIDGKLTVLVDGTNVFGTLALPYVPTAGRFGLFARTGGQNESHYVDDLSIAVTSLDLTDTVLGGIAEVVGTDVVYTAPASACGTDSFGYLVSDGQLGGVSTGLVSILLIETNPQPPVIVACVTNRTVVLYATEQYTLADLTTELVVTDCGTPTLTQSPLAGTLLNEGTHVITFTATDNTGSNATCQAEIVVQISRPQFISGSASYSGGTFTALFQTANGVNYRVEYADNLNPPAPTWNLLMTIAGDGTVKQVSDAGPLPNQRYYRIVPQP